jgi:serine/threonine-protein kinase
VILDRDRVGRLLPAYDIGDEIGRGGWGIVLQARHRQLGRDVAIKQLPRAFGNDPAVRGRFVAEARVLASLDHPHIVPVYDYVEQDGMCLLVMEKLTGGTVWSHFTQHGLAPENACAIALATLTALERAHRRGVLHRDIKPENLLLSGSNVLKVSDFGIATVIGGSETVATRAGEILGTPAYMAPEQAQGADLSPATDLYAVGIMLYELLSGQLPFSENGDPFVLLYRHVYEQPKLLTDVAPGVDAGVAEIVMQAMAKAPADRFPSAEAFGLILAERATGAWGVGWLSQSEFSVMASGAILSVTERAGARRNAPSEGSPRISGVVRPTFEAHRPSQLAFRSEEVQLVPVREVASVSMQQAPSRQEVQAYGVSRDPSVLELRQAVMGGQAGFSTAEVDELLRLTSEAGLAVRAGFSPHASVEEQRATVRAGVERWRTRSASPLADRTKARLCESAARLYEAIHAEIDGG